MNYLWIIACGSLAFGASFQEAMKDTHQDGLHTETKAHIQQTEKLIREFLSNRVKFYFSCKKAKNTHSLCQYVMEIEQERLQRKHRHRRRQHVKFPAALKKLNEISPDDWVALLQRGLSSAELSRVIKLIAETLQKERCYHPHIAFSLGISLEEHLKKPFLIEDILPIYDHAIRCGGEEIILKATLRKALLQIYQQKFQDAYQQLENVLHQKNIKVFLTNPLSEQVHHVVLRAQFWHLALKKMLYPYQRMEEESTLFLKQSNFGFHSYIVDLWIREKKGDFLKQFATLRDPIPLVFRAEEGALYATRNWNEIVRVTELLLVKRQVKVAGEFMAYFSRALKSAMKDPTKGVPFFLYWMILLRRGLQFRVSFCVGNWLLDHVPTLRTQEAFMKALFPLEYQKEVMELKKKFSPSFLSALIRQESSFEAHAKSGAKAIGLMQLLQSVANQVLRKKDINLMNPRENIRAGVAYLHRLTHLGIGRMDYLLAAYNAGPKKVKLWQERYATTFELLWMDLIPYRETRDYIDRVAGHTILYQKLYFQNVPSSPTKIDWMQPGIWNQMLFMQ